jgi:hypothetical protein
MLADSARAGQAPYADLARRFAWFADNVFHGASPLYEQVSREIAGDEEILAIAAAADPQQPIPVLFFGAVQYLLLEPGDDPRPLLMYYPSLSGDPNSPDREPYLTFREFCIDYRAEIEEIISTRRVQTNEVRRCTAWVPMFSSIAAQTGQPLALIELGASAGLNLLWDYYAYDYGDAGRVGDPGAPLVLTCEVRGDQPPPIPQVLPEIASRVGIDLYPVDVADPEQARWLRALIWAEHSHRARQYETAIEIVRDNPPQLIAGDILDLLPEALAYAAPDAAVCVYHSYVLNQFPEEAREELHNLLLNYSYERVIHRASIEWIDGGDVPRLRYTWYANGEAGDTLLANCDQHGAWIEWLAAD